jgi:uncharacterized protein (DUF427 family)
MVQRIEPGPGQESVWDYPRPPRVEPTAARVRVVHRGIVVADTTFAQRVLETSQAPAYYLPPGDVRTDLLVPSAGSSWCEWKGQASYRSLSIDGVVDHDVAWSYESPTAPYAAIAGYVSFYAQCVDECWVDDERVVANEGSFYGGWITSAVVGPFKGGRGTYGW